MKCPNHGAYDDKRDHRTALPCKETMTFEGVAPRGWIEMMVVPRNSSEDFIM